MIITNELQSRKEYTVIRKSLIALAAAATFAGFAASQAEAKIQVNGYINLGLPGIYVGSGYPVYDDYSWDEPDCGWQLVKHKKWKNGHKKIYYTKEWVCG